MDAPVGGVQTSLPCYLLPYLTAMQSVCEDEEGINVQGQKCTLLLDVTQW